MAQMSKFLQYKIFLLKHLIFKFLLIPFYIFILSDPC